MKKLRQIISVILLFSQAFGSLLILADFELNRDFIAEVLCINRDKPELDCGGKCHLQKELEKERENKTESSVSVFLFVSPALTEVFTPDFLLDAPQSAKRKGPDSIGRPRSAIGSIFHPPVSC